MSVAIDRTTGRAQDFTPLGDALMRAERCRSEGRLKEAEDICNRILEVQPESPEAEHVLGMIAHQNGKLDGAIKHLERAIALAPKVALYHANLGEMYRLAVRPQQAAEQARLALAIEPGMPMALSNLGVALYEIGDFEQSVRTHREAIAAKPNFADAHSNLGNALHALRRFDEAIAAYRRAIELKPDFADAWSNLGTTLHHAGDLESAAVALRRAIALAPHHANARSGLSILMLMRGEFAEGWQEYEWRLSSSEYKGPRFPLKPWQGEDLAGKHIYIKAEQGLGDTLQFARYLPLLAARGGKVTAHVQQPLVSLLRESLPGINVVGNHDGAIDYDCDAALLSLSRLFKTRLETIPANTPYLRAPAEATLRWKTRLATAKGLIVGIVWAGNPKHTNNLRRSLDVSLLTPLMAVRGTYFASLQVGPRAADLNSLDPALRVEDLSPQLTDFSETAGAIAALDLVITVDTSVAHLAGALGKPVWLLVPWVTDWRWMLRREDSPWYPTMRLFRQNRGEDWTRVIAGMTGQLQAVADGDTAPLIPFKAEGERRAALAAATIAAEASHSAAGLQPQTARVHRSPNQRAPLGKQVRNGGSPADAGALSGRVTALKSNEAESAHGRGLAAHRNGKLDEAIKHLEQAVALAPQVAPYHANLGEMYRLTDRPQQAADQARLALAIEPAMPAALTNLGISLYDLGKFEESLHAHRQAIAADVNFADAHCNLGNALHALWRFDEAIAAYRRAIELRPDFAQAWSNLSNALQDAGDFEEAEAVMRHAVALAPNGRSGLSTLLLRRGEFGEGWDEYEWRLRSSEYKGPRFPLKPWQGEGLAGKHIYIKAEQGLGDTLQFARYLPLLAARGGKVTARVQQLLVDLLRESLPGINVVGNRDGAIEYDCDAALLSLPRLFKTRLETIPASTPYLRAPAETALRWKTRLATAKGLKIGIAWAGNPKQANNLRRSLDVSLLTPLMAVRGTYFASLQVGPRVADLSSLDPALTVEDLSPQLTDFSETAGAIAALDLIITVDTSVAHLAGALGKPVWVPLSSVACWRYLLEREDSPWYPTMRLFRQNRGEDWTRVIASMMAQLQAVADGDTAPLMPFKAVGERRAAEAAAIISIEAARATAAGQGRAPTINPRRALIIAEQKRAGGFLAEAEDLARRAAAAEPNNAEAAHLLGIIAHQSGRLDEAIEHLRHAVALNSDSALYYSNLCEMYRVAGRTAEAVTAGRRALLINPNFPDALNNIGIALFDQNQFDEALKCYDRAIELRGDSAHTQSNRGNALLRLKRFSEAETAYRRAIELQPSFAQAWNNLGTCLRELKRPEEAETVYRRALQLRPDNADTLDNLALALKDLDRPEESLQLFRRALTVAPRDDRLYVHYGSMLLDEEKVDEAAAAAEQAIAISPNNYDAINLRGRIAFRRGELRAAIDHYHRALSLKPDLADAYNNMGNALKDLGQLKEAEDAYLKALQIEPSKSSTLFNLADVKKFTPGDPHLTTMAALASRPENLSKIERIELDFALGKAYGDVKDYNLSIAHLLSGNAAKRATISYPEESALALFDKIEAVFTPELIAAKSGGGDVSSMPIFVIGMPRSGTTLVEQIIASHPLVHGAGELPTLNQTVLKIRRPDGSSIPYPEFLPAIDAAGLAQIGTQYINAVRALMSGAAQNSQHVTDKMPSNYYYAGLIHLALPNAKIIHTVRDPIDTCLSCFSKFFAAEQNHTYDLGEIGRYHKRYQQLMKHWHSVLPVGRIFDVRYEEVVAGLETQARRIIDHCGLPWDDRCLSFYKTDRPVRTASASQIRQPIYNSSVGRWRAFEDHLGPLLAGLGIAGRDSISNT